MKIVTIFDKILFTFHYNNEFFNEFERLIDLWTDVSYLKKFADTEKIIDPKGFINDILNDVDEIQDLIEDIVINDKQFELYFRPLSDSEYQIKKLSHQKGKLKSKSKLRIYAIKIDTNCFVITGGAIKMSQTMQGHPITLNEITKLNLAKEYLKNNNIFDSYSFYELLND